MSLYVKQDETRTRLQQEIAAELQEKARKKAAEAERPDGVEDSRYIENTKRSTSVVWVWLIVIAAVIAVAIYLIIKGAS
jgi:hypothetical protein